MSKLIRKRGGRPLKYNQEASKYAPRKRRRVIEPLERPADIDKQDWATLMSYVMIECGDGEAYTLEEIGDFCGITKERVRQIEAEALKKIRNRLKDDELEAILRGFSD